MKTTMKGEPLPEGIYNRPTKGGVDRLYVAVRWNGQQERKCIGRNLGVAVRQLMKAEDRIARELPPFKSEENKAAATVADVLRQYHADHVPNKKLRSRERMDYFLRYLERHLGRVKADDLTYELLLHYRRDRRAEHLKAQRDARWKTVKPLSDVTAKKEFSHLRAALRYAAVNGKVSRNVFERLSRGMRQEIFPDESKGKGQFVEQEAFEAIVANLPRMYVAPARLAWLAGARKGEICALRHENIKRDRITIRDEEGNKTGSRDVPLTDEMRALLPPRNVDPKALLFTAADGLSSMYHGFGQAWDEARKKAGHPTVRLHDLRHTRATDLDAYGDRGALKAALGMSDATVARYAEHRKFERAQALFEKAATR